MRSIGLSLMVYFLGLLAVALGVASVIGYETSRQTLEAKKDATAQLIESQYAERCRAEQKRLDDDLLAQAQTLARVAHFQFDRARLHYRALNALGLLAVVTAPNAYVLAPTWAGQAAHGQFSFDLNRKNLKDLGEITLDDREVLEQVSPYYFQINSVWGASERSKSLGEHLLPVDSQAFTAEQGPPWKAADYMMAQVGPMRRVTLKTSVPITPSPRHGRGDYGRDNRSSPPPPSRQLQPRRSRGDRPPSPPQPPELQPRSAIFVQCAASTNDRDLAVALLKARRNDALIALDAETNLSLARLRNRLLLTSGVAFLLAVVGCFGLVRLGLSPLRRLSDAVSRVSEKDFRLQVDQRRMPGELQPIMRRLTATLEMLKRAFAREKQATADISHELRTPLSALLTMTEMALRKPRSAEEYQEVLRDCRLSAQRMTQGVEQLLALARLDAGVDRLRPVPIDAAELAEQCAALVRPLAEARGLTLTVHRNGSAPLTADADKLREVLTNLLHNAIEYNRPNGAVDLTVARENGRLDVAVKDTGVGISSEAKTHLFERFYRADPSRGGDGLHTGLGLAIAKGYIDLMGGDLAVESVEGEGSTFRVRLPATSLASLKVFFCRRSGLCPSPRRHGNVARPSRGRPARWRQDPEVQLMLRTARRRLRGLRRVGRRLPYARFGLVLSSAGRPRGGGRPDARRIPPALSRSRLVQAASQLRHLGFPHRSERGSQRPAFPATEAVLSTRRGRGHGGRHGRATAAPRRSAVAVAGARRIGRRGARRRGRTGRPSTRRRRDAPIRRANLYRSRGQTGHDAESGQESLVSGAQASCASVWRRSHSSRVKQTILLIGPPYLVRPSGHSSHKNLAGQDLRRMPRARPSAAVHAA